MDSTLATLAALFLLFAAASCAPAALSLQDACADVRSSSMRLNHIAKTVSVEARNGSKVVSDFSTPLVWMEAKDMCDPETLKQNSALCIGKILDVLTRYQFTVERVSGFQSCSEFAHQVKPALQKLHEDMSKCVGNKHHLKKPHISKEEIQPVKRWEEAPLCHYTMDRLFSFSIFTARVFAVGDPAHHSHGSAQKCL